MISLENYPNIQIAGALIFNTAMETFGSKDEALWRSAADSYEKSVERIFTDKLARWATGRAVLSAIGRMSPLKMLVIPELDTDYDRKKDIFLAQAGASAEMWSVRHGGDHAVITFTPAHWRPSETTIELTKTKSPRTGKMIGLKRESGPGSPPDEVLLHEAVHGLRFMSGIHRGRNVPFQRRYDSFEEFYAILITNIYRSEQGKRELRKDHTNFDTLASIGIQNSSDFCNYRLNKLHLKKLGRQQPALFFDLRVVKALFNPLALIDPFH